MAGKSGSFVRILSLLWADILVGYALFVMQNYLTDVWELSFTHSAAILNVWGGVSMILPVFFLFLVDQFLGHFTMLALSSIAYSVGIAFIAMSTPSVLANSTHTCKEYKSDCIGDTQKVLFYIGLALSAVGVAGHEVSIKPFLNQQKKDPNDKLEARSVLHLLGFVTVVFTPIIGAIALPYIKPWSIRFGIPAICTLVATVLFLIYPCSFKIEGPTESGSPITNICRVYVACVRKIRQPFPLDARLYKKDDKAEKDSFTHTRFLRCLERAAVMNSEDDVNNKWKLCSVAEVEEAKIAVRMIPMWMTFIVCGIISSIGNTYFVEQANHMNRRIGLWNLPLPILLLFFKAFKSGFENVAGSILSISKKYAPSFGIAVAMIFSILCCITAAGIETQRLKVITRHSLLDKPDDKIPMSIYVLLPQFFFLAALDAFHEKSVVAFYDYQAPDSMKDYLGYLTRGVAGLGFMCSAVSVHVVGRISESGGRRNWFQFTLNRSRLDRYYWVLAGLSSVNLVVFILVALGYRYKNFERKDGVEGDTEMMAGPSGEVPQEEPENKEEEHT